jgi:hypothetical protein
MFKKALLIVIALAFLCVPALAGDRPEFDAVGDDSANFFNDFIKDLVVANNPWNLNSAWPYNPLQPPFTAYEGFLPPVQLTNDLCFGHLGYQSAYTQWHRPARYTYFIVLQMDPQTDLDINIVDCVSKNNSTSIFGAGPFDGAEQTGRTYDWLGNPIFNAGANPQVTAQAIPGPFHVFGFTNSFTLNNRTQGGLFILPFNALLYTSKALWEEGLVAVMPELGFWDFQGVPTFPLSAGDVIRVDIDLPPTSTADVRYGSDNVVIKYVGVTGTIFTN